MVGWWRWCYYVLGWEYPEYYDNRQQHLKHKLCEQINKTDNIKKILKSSKVTSKAGATKATKTKKKKKKKTK